MKPRVAAAALLVALATPCAAMVIDPVDPAFGVAIAESPNGARPFLLGLAPAPGGRVAALSVHETAPYCLEVTLTMFDAVGAIDPAFGQSGRASGKVLGLPACAGAAALAVGSDGAIYLVSGDDVRMCVRKAHANGQADTSFGCAVLPGIDVFTRPTLQVLPDGAIAIGGTGRRVGTEQWGLAVARLLASGAPDTAYGSGGLAFAVPPDRPIFVQEGGGMAVNADGSALVAGNIFEDDAGARTYTDATVVRFDARGALDTTYGERGFAIPLRDASTYVQSLAARDGVAYLAGVQNRDVDFAFVVKIDAAGRVDLRYGNAGFAGTDQFYETNFEPVIAVDAAHRVYYLITTLHLVPRVTRLTRDGVPDAAFGLDGSAYPAAPEWSFAGRGRMALDAGTLYVAADDLTPRDGSNGAAFGVTRFRADGGHREDIAGSTAVIYYNPSLDHYFMTANAAEQASTVAAPRAGGAPAKAFAW